MEGGGATMALSSRPIPVPVVLVRGSDHADAHKEELDSVGKGLFRSYAMRNATQL